MDPASFQITTGAHPPQRHEHRYAKLNYKQAVLATLAYFDLFQYPLTREEATGYLFKLEPEPHHIEMTLNETRLITGRGSYVQLEGDVDHIATRHDRELVAKQFWKRVERFRWVFQLVPYIRLVVVCNNLAINNVSAQSDIDLLVVTKPGHLFTSRLLLTWWLQVLGVRRHGGESAGRFCLSFFVTEGNLYCQGIEKKPYDIYLAYWLQTLQPITGERYVYEEMLRLNQPWAYEFFKKPLRYNMHHFKEAPHFIQHLQKFQEKWLNSIWGQKLEEKLKKWQLKRARAKQREQSLGENDVIINQDMLKFHIVDKRKEIYERWISRLTALLRQH